MTIKTLTIAFATLTALGFQATAQVVTEPVTQAAPATPVSTPAQPISDPLSRAAAVYATYQGDVTDVKRNGFTSAGDIDRSLSNLGGHNPDLLTQGFLSYSALVASQDPEYRAALRDQEAYYGREMLLNGLKNDVRYARSLNGGDNAVVSSLSAVSADSRRLLGAAAFVKEQAYSLQGKGWAKGKVGDTNSIANNLLASTQRGIPARGGMMRAMASPEINSVLAQAGQAGSPSVWESVTGAASSIRVPTFVSSIRTKKRIAYGQEPIADRISTLAAYRILGADATTAAPMRTAMSERLTKGCLNMANLNLQQCVAAAHKHYEVPFCIGEHALSDVGKCIGKVVQ